MYSAVRVDKTIGAVGILKWKDKIDLLALKIIFLKTTVYFIGEKWYLISVYI